MRRRPGMYTDTSRPNHLAQEVIDNSVDEAIAGFAKKTARKSMVIVITAELGILAFILIIRLLFYTKSAIVLSQKR